MAKWLDGLSDSSMDAERLPWVDRSAPDTLGDGYLETGNIRSILTKIRLA